MLLHVVDISHPQYEEQMQVVNKTLQDLKCYDKPVITIFNKMDLYEEKHFDEWLGDEVKENILMELKERWENDTQGNCVFVSATEKRNIDELRTRILESVRTIYQVRYPYRTGFTY